MEIFKTSPIREKVDHRGAAAIADEREGDADHRHDPHYHAGVDKDLPKEIDEKSPPRGCSQNDLWPPHRLENTQ